MIYLGSSTFSGTIATGSFTTLGSIVSTGSVQELLAQVILTGLQTSNTDFFAFNVRDTTIGADLPVWNMPKLNATTTKLLGTFGITVPISGDTLSVSIENNTTGQGTMQATINWFDRAIPMSGTVNYLTQGVTVSIDNATSTRNTNVLSFNSTSVSFTGSTLTVGGNPLAGGGGFTVTAGVGGGGTMTGIGGSLILPPYVGQLLISAAGHISNVDVAGTLTNAPAGMATATAQTTLLAAIQANAANVWAALVASGTVSGSFGALLLANLSISTGQLLTAINGITVGADTNSEAALAVLLNVSYGNAALASSLTTIGAITMTSRTAVDPVTYQLRLVRGDDYTVASTRQLDFTITGYPSFVGGTMTLTVWQVGMTGSTFTANGTSLSYSAGPPQSNGIRFELPKSMTTLLPTDRLAQLRWDVKVTLPSGDVITPIIGGVAVLEDLN